MRINGDTPQPSISPWVEFKLETKADVSSTANLLLGSVFTVIIDSIWVFNQGDQDLSLNLYILREVGSKPLEVPLIRKKTLKGYEYLDLMKNGMIYLEASDLLYGYTDFSGSKMTVATSYRILKELTTPEIQRRKPL